MNRPLRAIRDIDSKRYQKLSTEIHDHFCSMPNKCDVGEGYCHIPKPHHHCMTQVHAENLSGLAWRLHHPIRWGSVRLRKRIRYIVDQIREIEFR